MYFFIFFSFCIQANLGQLPVGTGSRIHDIAQNEAPIRVVSVNCPGAVCSVTPNLYLPNGNYTWSIQTYNPIAMGPVSAPMGLTVSIPTATLIAPEGTITTRTPTYSWNEVPPSTQYQLAVNTAAGAAVFRQWYQAGDVCTGGVCEATPTFNLPNGSYNWYIQAYNPVGAGPWSAPKAITVTVP